MSVNGVNKRGTWRLLEFNNADNEKLRSRG